MVRHFPQYGNVGLNRIFEAVFLDKTLRAIQLLDDIYAHVCLNSFLGEVAALGRGVGRTRIKSNIYFILSRRRAPNRSLSAAQSGNSGGAQKPSPAPGRFEVDAHWP